MSETEAPEVQVWATDQLKPYDNNARKISELAVEKVAASIRNFGFRNPILANAEGVIIAGHTRLQAAKSIGLGEVPVIVCDLDQAQEMALRLADNRTAQESEWDYALLRDELAELDETFNADLIDTGFDPSELATILEGIVDLEDEETAGDDEAPEVSEGSEPDSRLGEIYELGPHRLMCGDSTSADDVQALMGGEQADMVFTDPPYGMKKEADGVLNDNLNFDDLLEFNRDWIALSFASLTDVGSWYCWGIDEPLMDIYAHILKPMIKANEATFRNLLTWDKGNGMGQLSDEFRSYATADEKCLFVMKGVQGFNNNADNYHEGWEPIRLYLKGERDALGWNNKKVADFFGFHPRMADHWFSMSQWAMPKRDQYERMQKEADGKAFKREYDDLKREWMSTRAYFDNTHDNMNNVWHFNRTPAEERAHAGGHATPKPIALCARAIKSSSRPGETVLDLFGGSGSTLIACAKTGRDSRLMELEPRFCDVIRKRWTKWARDNNREVGSGGLDDE